MYYQIEAMDGFWRIGSAEGVFCYLLAGEKKALLIDTGYGFGDLRGAVRSVTDKPLIIVNTHGHCDHTGGNAQFEEPCRIHEADIALCREHNTEEVRRANAQRLKNAVNYETGETYYGLPEEFDEDAYAARGSGNLAGIEPGTVLDLGGITAEILWTPGHTKGGISVWYREKNIVFIGDATGFFVWLYADHSTDCETYVAMLDRLYELNADGYYGGHNPQVMKRGQFASFRRAALEADYEKGTPFQTFMDQDRNPRVCALDGMTLEDMFKPGFAAVVVSSSWNREKKPDEAEGARNIG